MPIQRTPGTGGLVDASRQAGSFRPTSSWARCSSTPRTPGWRRRTSPPRSTAAMTCPDTTEAEQGYLTHPQLLDLAKETARFETLTSVLGYCGCRFGEAAALRRRTSVIGRSPSAPRPHTSQDKESWKRTTRPNGERRASCSRVVRAAICRWVSTAGYSTGHRRPCGTRPKPSANKSWLMTVK
jgi:hypothetical protein